MNTSLHFSHHYLEPFELEIREISALPELLDRITLPPFRPHFIIPDELPERSKITSSISSDSVIESDILKSPGLK